MNPKAIAITLTASLLLSTGCAAKNRWFSRKDYSEVQDPFMEGSEVASTEQDSGDTAGRARLGNSTLAAGSGPKPITRTASSSTSTASNPSSGSRTTAAYPDETPSAAGAKPSTRSLSGSDLSQFLNSGGKAMPTETASAGRSGMPAPNLADPRSAAARPSAGSLSPAARAAAMPSLEEEEGSFAGFMQKQTNAVNSVAQKATNKVQETEDSASDFASWANQQKAQWSQDGQNAVESVKAAPAATRNKVRAVSHEARTAMDNAAADFMTSPEFEDTTSEEGSVEEESFEEAAEPLFSKPAQKVPGRNTRAQPIPTREEADFDFGAAPVSSEESSDEPNPFENPFDMEEERAVQKPVPGKSSVPAKKSSRPTIDESFDMDSGWKPSGVSRP